LYAGSRTVGHRTNHASVAGLSMRAWRDCDPVKKQNDQQRENFRHSACSSLAKVKCKEKRRLCCARSLHPTRCILREVCGPEGRVQMEHKPEPNVETCQQKELQVAILYDTFLERSKFSQELCSPFPCSFLHDSARLKLFVVRMRGENASKRKRRSRDQGS
jgi:hypothetical protein